MEILTRQQARERGLKRYFLNKLCPKKHNAERFVSSGRCCQCTYDTEAAWRPLHKEETKVRSAAWDAANPERKKANGRRYRLDNKDKENARASAWQIANPQRVRANKKAWKTASPRPALAASLYMLLKNRPTSNPITPDELMEIFIQQKGRCAISKLKMTWSNGDKDRARLPTNVSIDRIDSNGDYTKGNVQLVCLAINGFKGQMSNKETVKMLKLIAKNLN